MPDMTEVLEDAYELVEDEVVTARDVCDFVFCQPARLYAEMNPDFFKGATVENDVDKLLASETA